VSGRERDEDDPPLFLDEAEALDAVAQSGRVAVAVAVEEGDPLPGDTVARARTVMERHLGPAPLELHVENGKGTEARLRSRSLSLDPSPALLEELKELLGPGRVRMVKV
ncbi:MAG: hypothetical protein ACOCUZ_02670, partial [bacterium]